MEPCLFVRICDHFGQDFIGNVIIQKRENSIAMSIISIVPEAVNMDINIDGCNLI